MREIWKPIRGFKNRYEVSNFGRTRSLPKKHILTPWCSGNGYLTVMMGDKRKHIHRLVLETFVGSCPKGMSARHFPDRNRSNNRLTNLSWGTLSQNQKDRVVHGTDGRGHKNPQAKLTWSDVRKIRKSKYGLTRLSNQFGVSRQTICKIKLKQRWRAK